MSRELDAEIAEKVMGWPVLSRYPEHGIVRYRRPTPDGFGSIYIGDKAGGPVFHPSTDIAAAALVEDEIEKRGLVREYIDALSDILDAMPFDDQLWTWQHMRATPEQRCKAALLAARRATEGQTDDKLS